MSGSGSVDDFARILRKGPTEFPYFAQLADAGYERQALRAIEDALESRRGGDALAGITYLELMVRNFCDPETRRPHIQGPFGGLLGALAAGEWPPRLARVLSSHRDDREVMYALTRLVTYLADVAGRDASLPPAARIAAGDTFLALASDLTAAKTRTLDLSKPLPRAVQLPVAAAGHAPAPVDGGRAAAVALQAVVQQRGALTPTRATAGARMQGGGGGGGVHGGAHSASHGHGGDDAEIRAVELSLLEEQRRRAQYHASEMRSVAEFEAALGASRRDAEGPFLQELTAELRGLRAREGELDELLSRLTRAADVLSAEGEWAQVSDLEAESARRGAELWSLRRRAQHVELAVTELQGFEAFMTRDRTISAPEAMQLREAILKSLLDALELHSRKPPPGSLMRPSYMDELESRMGGGRGERPRGPIGSLVHAVTGPFRLVGAIISASRGGSRAGSRDFDAAAASERASVVSATGSHVSPAYPSPGGGRGGDHRGDHHSTSHMTPGAPPPEAPHQAPGGGLRPQSAPPPPPMPGAGYRGGPASPMTRGTAGPREVGGPAPTPQRASPAKPDPVVGGRPDMGALLDQIRCAGGKALKPGAIPQRPPGAGNSPAKAPPAGGVRLGAPPPQPLGGRGGAPVGGGRYNGPVAGEFGVVQRAPQVVSLFQQLRRELLGPVAAGGRRYGAAAALDDGSNPADKLKAEIEGRSKYVESVKADVDAFGGMVKQLAVRVRAAKPGSMPDLVALVGEVTTSLSTLTDETAVLKHFSDEWPEGRFDTMREAASLYTELQVMKRTLATWETGAATCEEECKRIDAVLEKAQRRVEALERSKDADERRFRDNGAGCWDDRLYESVRHAALHLAECYMRRVLDEIPRLMALAKASVLAAMQAKANAPLPGQPGARMGGGPKPASAAEIARKATRHLTAAVRFAFRVHQFAGGFNPSCIKQFEDLQNLMRQFAGVNYSPEFADDADDAAAAASQEQYRQQQASQQQQYAQQQQQMQREQQARQQRESYGGGQQPPPPQQQHRDSGHSAAGGGGYRQAGNGTGGLHAPPPPPPAPSHQAMPRPSSGGGYRPPPPPPPPRSAQGYGGGDSGQQQGAYGGREVYGQQPSYGGLSGHSNGAPAPPPPPPSSGGYRGPPPPPPPPPGGSQYRSAPAPPPPSGGRPRY